MIVEKLEEEAKISAAKQVANMIQRADQLEKIDQYKRRILRKKVSVEAMLKTAVSESTDGVRNGLIQLRSSLRDISEIRIRLREIEECLKPLPSLCLGVKQVQHEHVIYSQYAVAMENLKHIFQVPESVEKTRQWITEGRLLTAHQSISDLENSRDDLLFELHRLPSHSLQEKQTLKAYFCGVEQLSELLGKQLWLVLGRSLNIVRKEPQVVVTAVRIIEREEKTDTYAVQRQKQSGFLPPGRPKQWKARAIQVLGDQISQRIEGNQFEDRNDNKMWLVRHLEVTRLLIIEDLRVVKTLCAPCFPPHWDIVNQFVQLYHSKLTKHLEEIVSAGLIGNEYVTLLHWVIQTYPGPELLQSPDLRIEPSSLGPLLTHETVEDLLKAYLSNMGSNYGDWMSKTLETEARDWRRPVVPDSDGDGHFHTEASVIIFQMVEQNLSVSQTISDDLMLRALNLGIEQISQYGLLYKDAINTFKIKHFEDRSQVPYFTHYLIAIVNNCLHIMELAQQMRTRYLKAGDTKNSKSFDRLLETYQRLRDETAGFLLEEAFLDLEPHFQDLFTRKWLSSTVPVDTICATLEDYFQDYMHLKPRNFDYVIREAELCITRKYIASVFQKKLSLKTEEERREAAEKMIREAGQIADLLAPASPSLATSRVLQDAPQEAISALAEIVKSDMEMLPLELHGFIKKYPDMSQDQLVCLLFLRGDVGRLELRQVAAELLADRIKEKSQKTTILAQIPVSSSLFS